MTTTIVASQGLIHPMSAAFLDMTSTLAPVGWLLFVGLMVAGILFRVSGRRAASNANTAAAPAVASPPAFRQAA
jgi:hypothetical protein